MHSKTFAILALTEGLLAKETPVFADEFNFLDFTKWQHEITMSGGGNWEFEMYGNNRTNSFVKEGVLHIQPTLAEDRFGFDTLRYGSVSLYGSSKADDCTSNQFWGCERSAAGSGNMVNPIQSARLRSFDSFAFKYGRMEIRAQLPKGDWIWPAIWLLPKHNAYGNWPASGEIDLVESRGNDASCETGGRNAFGSTLHYGPGWPFDAWDKAFAQHTSEVDLSDDFHLYGLEWTETGLRTTIDGVAVLDYPFDESNFKKGGFPDGLSNPWEGQANSAPFD